MRLIPDLELASLRAAYSRRDQARFDVLGAQLGLDVKVLQLTLALRIVVERDLHVILGVIVRQIHAALASPHGYGFAHVAESGTRVYTCLAVRDGGRVVASVQPSVKGNPLPNPGWNLPRWNPDEPARNAKAVMAWARDPARTHDAGVFPMVKALPWSEDLAADDVRRKIRDLQRTIEATALRDPHRAKLREREDELLRDHRALIIGELGRMVESYVIRGGVVDSITLRASRLARGLDVVAAHLPRRVCILVDRAKAWSEIAESGLLPRIRDLEITGLESRPFKMHDVDITKLAGRSDVLERLAVTWVRSSDQAWQRVLADLHAPALRAIRVVHADIGAAGLEALSSPTVFPQLVEIGLGAPAANRDVACERLRSIGARPNLRALDVCSFPNTFDDAIIPVLENASSLTSLTIDNQDAADRILDPLASALAKRPFDRVALDGHAFTPEGLARWIRSPGFANLAYLRLHSRWRIALVADALLSTNGRTRVEILDSREITPALAAHIDYVRTRDDGSVDRVS